MAGQLFSIKDSIDNLTQTNSRYWRGGEMRRIVSSRSTKKCNGMSRLTLRYIWLVISGFAVLSGIFYFEAYFSVSQHLPSSIPIHHDDYTNYAGGATAFQWSWNRPFSTYVIHLLGLAGPAWLSGAIRFFSVLFVLFSWVLLCQVVRPRAYWLMFIAFGTAVFSTPVIVEYARYTGMITHLLSGCLGLAAVVSLFRSAVLYQEGRSGLWWLFLSVSLLILSSLAKEDFILFYALSLVYAVLRWPVQRKRLFAAACIGLLSCIALIAASKFLASSSFLGVADNASSYYINLTPASVIQTVWHYLIGASHPSMHMHGKLVAFTFGAATIVAIALAVCQRAVPRTAYFVLATLTLIAPYSVLPNHVNAYYELVWLPMVFAAAVAATTEIFLLLPNSSAWRSRAPILVLLALAVVFSVVDYPRRANIVDWYDTRAQSNARVLGILEENRSRINAARAVCVTGADAFSPWFMHSGEYLRNVMDLRTQWYLILEATSPLYVGVLVGANSSNGQTILTTSTKQISEPCLHINLDSK